MKKIPGTLISLLLCLISFSLAGQELKDSIVLNRFVKETGQDINRLENRFRELQQTFNIIEVQQDTELNYLQQSDSLLREKLDSLSKKLFLAESNLARQNSLFELQIARLNKDYARTRKSYATLAIILFSLLVFLFIYFYYRDYKLESLMNQEIMNNTLDIERRYSRLKSSMKKKMSGLSREMDKNVKKRIKKTHTKLDRKIRKNRRAIG